MMFDDARRAAISAPLAASSASNDIAVAGHDVRLLFTDPSCNNANAYWFSPGIHNFSSIVFNALVRMFEQALKANPDIFDCLVVGVPDERFGSRVAAVVSPRGDAQLSLATVQEEARKHIAGYKIPRELHVVAEVPRAPSGKPAYPKALAIALVMASGMGRSAASGIQWAGWAGAFMSVS